jgi:hypothetical protein
VDGDAVGSRAFAEDCKGDGIGLDRAANSGGSLPVAGLTNGGAVIDVNAEKDHEDETVRECGRQEIRKCRTGEKTRTPVVMR